MSSSYTLTDITKEQYHPLPLQTSHRAVSGKNFEMNFPTPEHSYTQNTNPRDTYSTMAVAQRPHAFSGSDWRGLEPSRPRMANVQESLPSIRTVGYFKLKFRDRTDLSPDVFWIRKSGKTQ